MSGQIMPFLLVIIAIFLGAFVSVANIGQVAMNMTCNDNAADACALAAASHMALILNGLHKDQGDAFKPNFAIFKSIAKLQSLNIHFALLAAKINLLVALSEVNSAISQGGAHGYCTYWADNQAAATHFSNADTSINLAVKSIKQAILTVKALKAAVKSVKDDANKTYCRGLDVLQDEYMLAKRDGIQYALENNCVYPNLSTDQQNEIFEMMQEQDKNDEAAQDAAAQSGEQSYLEKSGQISSSSIAPIENTRDTEYGWQDANGNDHSMGAKVNIPKIASFELEVVKMNKPCGPSKGVPGISQFDHYGDLNMLLVYFVLNGSDFNLIDLGQAESAIADASSTASQADPCQNLVFDVISQHASELITMVSDRNIVKILTEFIPLIDNLIQHNDDVLKDLLPPDGGKRIISSKSCADAGDVIIVGINDVKFESGCIGCEVDMSHAGGSSSGTGMSSFGGGNLSPAQPDQHYIPGLLEGANGNCPADTGLTTGTTSGSAAATHPDGGCSGR